MVSLMFSGSSHAHQIMSSQHSFQIILMSHHLRQINLKKHITITLSILASVVILFFFAYLLERTNFYQLISSFSILFGLFLYQYKKIDSWKLLVLVTVMKK